VGFAFTLKRRNQSMTAAAAAGSTSSCRAGAQSAVAYRAVVETSPMRRAGYTPVAITER
jgi:hypothetical protein